MSSMQTLAPFGNSDEENVHADGRAAATSANFDFETEPDSVTEIDPLQHISQYLSVDEKPKYAKLSSRDFLGILPLYVLTVFAWMPFIIGSIILLYGSYFCSVGIAEAIMTLSGFENRSELVGKLIYGLKNMQMLFLSSMAWIPVVLIVLVLAARTHPGSKPSIGTIVYMIVLLSIFGLILWGYCNRVSDTNVTYDVTQSPWTFSDRTPGTKVYWHSWSTGVMPRVPPGCEDRVAQPDQVSLFSPSVYDTQFARTYYLVPTENITWPKRFGIDTWWTFPAFDEEASAKIRNDRALCGQGFKGNADLYGLGIRTGIYLQWLSSMLANNFLSNKRQDIQKVYLVFSLAICLATVISALAESCLFSIEIQILYWLYWGGYIVVFASSPSQIALGQVSRQIKLDWVTAILFITHFIMAYHGLWFILVGYDQKLARLPCGTYHFFFVPVLDPSESFWKLRDVLNFLATPIILQILLLFPIVALLMIPEVKIAIQSSSVYRVFLGDPRGRDLNKKPTKGSRMKDKGTSLISRLSYRFNERRRRLQKIVNQPRSHDGEIRLLNTGDLKLVKLLRIYWAAVGLLAYILSICAIELTLKWNHIVGVYSIRLTGQYVPFIVGVGSFVAACWSLVEQESRMRDRIKYRHTKHMLDNAEAQEYEMTALTGNINHSSTRPHTMSGAISHAFSQPDAQYLMSDALPGLDDDGDAYEGEPNELEEQDVADISSIELSQAYQRPDKSY